jgi:hypothetical protein
MYTCTSYLRQSIFILHTYVHTMRNDPEVTIDQSGDEAVPRTGRGRPSGIGRNGDRPCCAGDIKSQRVPYIQIQYTVNVATIISIIVD